ncbi:protein of unknown function [Desulfofundulus australicus DSM 11792]|uniref:DUF3786 domain-containing protein n=2 Tax=Desulfofundulus australicus TaxID=1566 RepID=A0A1M5D398_9FIRM|nr:protein of unknown function [Desulfofundulus australicus DSM 11792]
MAWMNLEPAHRQAKEEFARRDPESMAFNAAVTYRQETQEFVVPFLGADYLVKYPGGEVKDASSGQEVPEEIRIVLLHYLARSSPARVEGRLISFQELPGGFIYTGPFNNRAVRPLVSLFGDKPDLLVQAAKMLGGSQVAMGDVAVNIPVLPKIPVTFLLWLGDDEFPPSGNVLFDASAPRHLPTEDYALLPGLALGKMRKIIQSGGR